MTGTEKIKSNNIMRINRIYIWFFLKNLHLMLNKWFDILLPLSFYIDQHWYVHAMNSYIRPHILFLIWWSILHPSFSKQSVSYNVIRGHQCIHSSTTQGNREGAEWARWRSEEEYARAYERIMHAYPPDQQHELMVAQKYEGKFIRNSFFKYTQKCIFWNHLSDFVAE